MWFGNTDKRKWKTETESLKINFNNIDSKNTLIEEKYNFPLFVLKLLYDDDDDVLI